MSARDVDWSAQEFLDDLDDLPADRALRELAREEWDWQQPTVEAVARRLVEMYGALVSVENAIADPEPSPSVPTCEKVPINAAVPDFSEGGLSGGEPPETADDLNHTPDALAAIQASISRSRERQRKVLALIERGEVAHAKRLATCARKSVQLECPELAGGCGSDDNYVPLHCDSRLCPDCMKRRQGRLAEKYTETVAGWDHATMLRLSLPERVDPADLEDAVSELREAFGRFRRRVIQPEGEHQGKRWVWWRDGEQPADHYWKPALHGAGRHDLVRRFQQRYVEQGRGIPVEELLTEGFYGVDVKEKEDGRLNVHLHVLAECPYLPQAALAAEWDDIVGAPVVDIRRIEERGEQDAESALMEVVGYAAKAPEYESVDAEADYFQALKGAKLIQPFGELHGNTPDVFGLLRCGDCENAPRWWNYHGVVDGQYSTAIVGGSSADGDRPPPEET